MADLKDLFPSAAGSLPLESCFCRSRKPDFFKIPKMYKGTGQKHLSLLQVCY